jgi:glycosyltransferase involved in cell wall biosynthesis
MRRRRCLLAIGQALTPTGYARVLQHITSELARAFEVVVFGLNYRGTEIEAPIRIVPNRSLGDPYGREQLPALLERVRPSIVLIHHDAYMYAIHEPALTPYRPECAVVVYCPVDSANDRGLTSFSGADLVVAYNEFGAEIISGAFSAKGIAPPPLMTIGHGVDTATFRPLDVAHARAALWPDRPELQNAFIVLNANRNRLRKNVGATIEGFARFAASRPDVYLCLHMAARGPTLNVRELIAKLGIEDRILTESGELPDSHPRCTDERLNLLYNACDVGINTASSEGWGLVSYEHGATCAAQIVPEHIACAHDWRDNALLLPDVDKAALPAVVASGIERLYGDARLREQLAAAAYRLATSEEMRWDAICTKWRRALTGLDPKVPVATTRSEAGSEL